MAVKRTRVYACVLYPESAPADWKARLDDLHVPTLVSPLHDKDVNNGTGEIKKAHYHVLIMFDGPKTQAQFELVRDYFGGVGTEFVQSVRGYARYLCHLDNAEKYQYNPDDVLQLNGACYLDIVGDTYDQKKCISAMILWINRTGCTSFRKLVDYSMKYEPDWYSCLLASSYFIKGYLESYYNELKRTFDVPEDFLPQ